jgi:hypothetical protein
MIIRALIEKIDGSTHHRKKTVTGRMGSHRGKFNKKRESINKRRQKEQNISGYYSVKVKESKNTYEVRHRSTN